MCDFWLPEIGDIFLYVSNGKSVMANQLYLTKISYLGFLLSYNIRIDNVSCTLSFSRSLI